MKTWRIDDIGASTKKFNQWGKTRFAYKGKTIFYFPWANYCFLKRLWPFKGWAPYDELTAEEWQKILATFKEHNIKPIIAITATWVDEKSNLIPFPEKFPAEARILKEAADKGEITIANHGLTHCIVGRHLPLFRYSNRKMHREFWPGLSLETHEEHIKKSQEILGAYFQKSVGIFVPAGGVWSQKTYQALKGTNLKIVMANRYMADSEVKMEGIEFINDESGFIKIHDRDLKTGGIRWLIKKIRLMK
jgi:peptidoglycan/xylan/chitin deacetylase (PgdA/CDA1 family)